MDNNIDLATLNFMYTSMAICFFGALVVSLMTAIIFILQATVATPLPDQRNEDMPVP